jgi:hypothetical protein
MHEQYVVAAFIRKNLIWIIRTHKELENMFCVHKSKKAGLDPSADPHPLLFWPGRLPRSHLGQGRDIVLSLAVCQVKCLLLQRDSLRRPS